MPVRPTEVAIDIGSSPDSPTRISSDFEEIPYPPNHRATRIPQDDLPLHYMTEDTARRRVPRGPGVDEKDAFYGRPEAYYDDGEGKDVYSKLRPKARVGSGRLHRPPPPPPTSVVRPFSDCCVLF